MGEEDVSALKAGQRKAAKRMLAAVAPDDRAAASKNAVKAVSALGSWPGAGLVLAFLSMPTELDTLPVVEAALAAGKRVAVPRISGDDIEFVELTVGWRSWPRDRWDIPAPPESLPPVRVADMARTPTLALVPGLAFDRGGGRLGRGKGYYDRFLSALTAARARLGNEAAPFSAIGLGYSFQLVARVPTDERDRPLDGLALC